MGHTKRTPLHSFHVKHSARLGSREGWEVPLLYSTVFEEHRAVRLRAGLVEEGMGVWLRLKGVGALQAIDNVLATNVSALRTGTAQRALFCNARGGVVSDLKVFALAEGDFLLQLGASRALEAFIAALGTGDFKAVDESENWAAFGLYGPRAEKVLSCITACDLSAMAIGQVKETVIAGERVCLARLQRLGEQGYLIFGSQERAEAVAEAILMAGKSLELCLVGREAWEALALEAGEPRYGAEVGPLITPLEAGLMNLVDLTKAAHFPGKAALVAQLGQGVKRCIVHFTFTDRRIAKPGITVWQGENVVGEVVGGALSPMLQQPIGTALVHVAEGSEEPLCLKVRRRTIPLHLKKPPLHAEAQEGELGAWSFVKGLAGVCVLL